MTFLTAPKYAAWRKVTEFILGCLDTVQLLPVFPDYEEEKGGRMPNTDACLKLPQQIKINALGCKSCLQDNKRLAMEMQENIEFSLHGKLHCTESRGLIQDF